MFTFQGVLEPSTILVPHYRKVIFDLATVGEVLDTRVLAAP